MKINDGLFIAGVCVIFNGWIFTGIFLVLASIEVIEKRGDK